MRLGTIETRDGSRAVVVKGPGAGCVVDDYGDVGELLRAGSEGWSAALAAGSGNELAITFDPAQILQPVVEPGAVICVGLNYTSHIVEMGRDLPVAPALFTKLARALTRPFSDVMLPTFSDRLDYEAELAVVIGKPGRDVAVDDVWSYVAGFTVFNDVTVRDYQRRSSQWFAGKSLQASTPVGPWLVTPDEVGDLAHLTLRLRVNGSERQRALLGDLVFGVPELVADVSRLIKLQPGDIIATGTPGGVGEADGRFLQDGDVVEVEIDRIGKIRNVFRGAER